MRRTILSQSPMNRKSLSLLEAVYTSVDAAEGIGDSSTSGLGVAIVSENVDQELR